MNNLHEQYNELSRALKGNTPYEPCAGCGVAAATIALYDDVTHVVAACANCADRARFNFRAIPGLLNAGFRQLPIDFYPDPEPADLGAIATQVEIWQLATQDYVEVGDVDPIAYGGLWLEFSNDGKAEIWRIDPTEKHGEWLVSQGAIWLDAIGGENTDLLARVVEYVHLHGIGGVAQLVEWDDLIAFIRTGPFADTIDLDAIRDEYGPIDIERIPSLWAFALQFHNGQTSFLYEVLSGREIYRTDLDDIGRQLDDARLAYLKSDELDEDWELLLDTLDAELRSL